MGSRGASTVGVALGGEPPHSCPKMGPGLDPRLEATRAPRPRPTSLLQGFGSPGATGPEQTLGFRCDSSQGPYCVGTRAESAWDHGHSCSRLSRAPRPGWAPSVHCPKPAALPTSTFSIQVLPHGLCSGPGPGPLPQHLASPPQAIQASGPPGEGPPCCPALSPPQLLHPLDVWVASPPQVLPETPGGSEDVVLPQPLQATPDPAGPSLLGPPRSLLLGEVG